MERHIIYGINKDYEQVILFTWGGNRADGIERAKRENKEFGGEYSNFGAIELKPLP